MIPIKFRGRKIGSKDFVYGSYHYSRCGKYNYILSLEKFIERENEKQVKALDEMCLFKKEVNDVDPSTIEIETDNGEWKSINDIKII